MNIKSVMVITLSLFAVLINIPSQLISRDNNFHAVLLVCKIMKDFCLKPLETTRRATVY